MEKLKFQKEFENLKYLGERKSDFFLINGILKQSFANKISTPDYKALNNPPSLNRKYSKSQNKHFNQIDLTTLTYFNKQILQKPEIKQTNNFDQLIEEVEEIKNIHDKVQKNKNLSNKFLYQNNTKLSKRTQNSSNFNNQDLIKKITERKNIFEFKKLQKEDEISQSSQSNQNKKKYLFSNKRGHKLYS